MIMVPLNFMALLLLLAVSAIDAMLFIVAFRLVLQRIGPASRSEICISLQKLTDPLADLVERLVSKCFGIWPAAWVSWLLVVASLFISRSILIVLLV